MGTFTAQILVGEKNSYESGIVNITHTLYLSENGRAAWILIPTKFFGGKEEKPHNRVVWIPTIENMLEDALVMIGLYVLKEERLISLAEQYFPQDKKDYIELYDIKPEHRHVLYECARSITSSHKIMLSVFQGASIFGQLPVLENYQNDIEVCRSIYRKELSVWNGQFEVDGKLVR
jgi:hypothetical protein